MTERNHASVVTVVARVAALLAACAAVACSPAPEGALAGRGRAPPGAPPAPTAQPAASPPLAREPAPDAGPAPPGEAVAAPGPCPADMVLVDTTYCPKPRLPKCVDDEYNAPNHLTICKRFSDEPQTCLGTPRRQRYCIDRYEYPSKKGAHPPVMVDAFDALGLCEARGKRLCWESEWVAACEGPDKTPFPYGRRRDASKCNIDNAWKTPDLDAIYSPEPKIHGPELTRLDQSVASGAKEGCVSGFGVHDLTGNFDEWVLAEEQTGKSKWARLKGGAWGHVRNACRPFTTSHPPEFTYYFISFRCCADAAGAPAGQERLWKPPPTPRHPDPTGKIGEGWTPALP